MKEGRSGGSGSIVDEEREAITTKTRGREEGRKGKGKGWEKVKGRKRGGKRRKGRGETDRNGEKTGTEDR